MWRIFFALGVRNRQLRVVPNGLIVTPAEGDDKPTAIQESVVRTVGPLVDVRTVDVKQLPLQDAVEGEQLLGRQIRKLLAESGGE